MYAIRSYYGIYREVKLEVMPKTNIPVWGVKVETPVANEKTSVVNIKTSVVNGENFEQNVTLKTTIMCGESNAVASTETTFRLYESVITSYSIHYTKLYEQQETFGPIAPMMKVKSFDEAIELANDCEYGLSAYLFTNNAKLIMRAVNELDFGEVYVNRENGELLHVV